MSGRHTRTLRAVSNTSGGSLYIISSFVQARVQVRLCVATKLTLTTDVGSSRTAGSSAVVNYRRVHQTFMPVRTCEYRREHGAVVDTARGGRAMTVCTRSFRAKFTDGGGALKGIANYWLLRQSTCIQVVQCRIRMGAVLSIQ